MGLCIIGAKDVRDYQIREKALVIDLRDRDEYRRFHIEGALNVPADELEQYMKTAPRSRTLIFCCQHGSLSMREGKRYAREGYRICSLAGGIHVYWQTFHRFENR